MSDRAKKITELTSITNTTSDDLLLIVNDPGSASAQTLSITADNLFKRGVGGNTARIAYANALADAKTYANTTAYTVAGIAYANSVTYANTIANTAYTNSIAYANTIAYTAAGEAYANSVDYVAAALLSFTDDDAAYTNSIAYANTIAYTAAGEAYANSVAYANTIADTAYANAVIAANTLAIAAYTNSVTYANTIAYTAAGEAYANSIAYANTAAATAYTNSVTYTVTAITGADVFISNTHVLRANTVQILRTETPANSIALTINQGVLFYDSDYIYIATAENTVKRVALNTF